MAAKETKDPGTIVTQLRRGLLHALEGLEEAGQVVMASEENNDESISEADLAYISGYIGAMIVVLKRTAEALDRVSA